MPIEDCDIDADDDAIVLKSETDVDFPVTNVVIRNCRLASSCNAFKFGTGSYNAFRDVLLENCAFTFPGGGTAEDATKPVSECETAYPDCTMFDNRRLPAWGLYVRHADDVLLDHVTFTLQKPDAREKFVFDDADVRVVGR